MPDLYRTTFFFAGASQGWSESYVFPRDGVTVATFNSLTATAIAQSRAQLLAREYKLVAFRTAKIRTAAGATVKRNADLVVVDYGPGGTTAGWRGCQPRECVIMNGISADGGREKKTYLRGIPDQVIEDAGQLNTGETIGWFSRLSSFQSLLLQAQAGWLQDITQGPSFNVVTYVTGANLIQEVEFQGNIFNALAVGTEVPVRLTGINGKSRLNGLLVMVVVSNTKGHTKKPLALGPFVAGGTGILMVSPKPFISAAAFGQEEARTHDTGKVSVATRGRRAATPRI